MVDSWPTAALGELVKKVELAREAGKYSFIVDKTGNVSTFFQYKGKLCEFYKQKLRVTMGSQDMPAALEDLRRSVAYASRDGDTLCVQMDRLTCDFKGECRDEAVFDGEKVFDFAGWHDDEKKLWVPYVKEEENSGPGGLNPGMFMVHKDFTIALVTTADDPEEVFAGIPHPENFEKFIIQ